MLVLLSLPFYTSDENSKRSEILRVELQFNKNVKNFMGYGLFIGLSKEKIDLSQYKLPKDADKLKKERTRNGSSVLLRNIKKFKKVQLIFDLNDNKDFTDDKPFDFMKDTTITICL